MNSYNPRVAMSFWVGNHVLKGMTSALSSIVGPTVNNIMGPINRDVFQKDGTWKPGDWFTRPAGVQTLSVGGRSDIFPSWYNKTQKQGVDETMAFDRVSKKKATDCTPPAARAEVTVQKITDPLTRQVVYIAPDGYDATKDDDVHKCDDAKPTVASIGANSTRITTTVTKGTHALQTIEFRVNGQVVGSVAASGTGSYELPHAGANNQTITVTVTDAALYTGTLTEED